MNPLRRMFAPAFVTAVAALSCAGALAVAGDASAAVRREGAWPSSSPKVSFTFDGKPSEGLKKLAGEAEWSLVMSKGIAIDEHDVHIAVDDQPADAVLDALFAESNVVAQRNGTLITVLADARGAALPVAPVPPAVPVAPAPPAVPVAPAPPAIPAAPAAPMPTIRGEDRNIMGGSLTVEKNEIVHTVSITGGSAKIYGTVTGDLVVAGGSAKIMEGAHVVGNVTVMGGSVHVYDKAHVDGDVGVVGGSLKRDEGAVIGGKIIEHDKEEAEETSHGSHDAAGAATTRVGRAAQAFGHTLTNMALLFVLGSVLMALAGRRMEKLRIETAARPMRSFALGIVGSFVALLGIVVACVTIIGIPFAIAFIIAATLATFGSMSAVLTTFGAAVLGHKTQNAYAHLLFGCAVFLVVLLLPVVGDVAAIAVWMIALGTLVSTRLGTMQRTPAPQLV